MEDKKPPPTMRLRKRRRSFHNRLYLNTPKPRAQAIRSVVYREEGFLKPDEIQEILDVIEALGMPMYTSNPAQDITEEGNPVHTTTYLNTDDVFTQHFLKLKNKIRALVHRVNKKEGWGFDTDSPLFNIRVAEYHEMNERGSLNDVNHSDLGSLVTVDIMLKEAGTGADFYTIKNSVSVSADITENITHLKKHNFKLGDALVFVSHKPHCVSRLIKGSRKVLVLEYWRGVESHCGHRCELPNGSCSFVDEEDDAC